MRENFSRSLGLLWVREGEAIVVRGKSLGANRRLGVTGATLASWRNCNIRDADLSGLNRGTASAILHCWFWRGVSADELPLGIDHAAFDLAVALDPKRAIAALHLALGVRPGSALHVGSCLLRAVANADPAEIITALCLRQPDKDRARSVAHESLNMIHKETTDDTDAAREAGA